MNRQPPQSVQCVTVRADASAFRWRDAPETAHMANPRQYRTIEKSLDTGIRWAFGVVPEALLAAYGLRCIVAQHAVIIGTRFRFLHLSGIEAIVLGCAWLALASLGFFHYFCGDHPRLEKHAAPGKLISMTVLAMSLLVVVIRVLFFN